MPGEEPAWTSLCRPSSSSPLPVACERASPFSATFVVSSAVATILIWSPARVADRAILAPLVVSRALSMILRYSVYFASELAIGPPPPASLWPLKNVEGVPWTSDP